MKFLVNDQLLRDMFSLSSFPVPDAQLVFVALRGCMPIMSGGGKFQKEERCRPMPSFVPNFLPVLMVCGAICFRSGSR